MMIPYDPAGPQREVQVGKLWVKGNDSFATVCKKGLVFAAIEVFDTCPSMPEPPSGCDDTSAFARAVSWARDHQDDPRAQPICELF